MKLGKFSGSGLAIGIGVGVALGVALNNIAIGVALGVAIGLCFEPIMAGKTTPDASDGDDAEPD